jgi:chromosome partitioning protein
MDHEHARNDDLPDETSPAAEQHETDGPGNGDGGTGPAGAPRRRTPWDTLDGRVISFVSRKGGVGKTTSAVNLGAALALTGHTVLVVGVDPQCGVCRSLGTENADLDTSLGEIFTHQKALTELAQTSPLRDLFYVSPRIDCLEDEESYLSWFESRTDDFVREIDQARILYDTILIDCPPNLGPATRAALLASDSYLVPVQAEELCRGTIDPLLDFVGDFRRRSFSDKPLPAPSPVADERPLRLEGLFLTMANERTRMGRHVAERLHEDFGEELFETGIPRTTRLTEMALRGKPAVIYDRRSPGSRAYFDLADELVYRFRRESEAADAAAADAAAMGEEPGVAGPEVGGLDRFLAELGGSRETSTRIPAFEEPPSPEMVSLDDLLAEEEDQSGEADDWGDDSWSGSRPH